MATEDRRARERAARRRLIVDTARQLAEAEGWDAVTTRRLSTEIEYSQPVLYKHFSGMERSPRPSPSTASASWLACFARPAPVPKRPTMR